MPDCILHGHHDLTRHQGGQGATSTRTGVLQAILFYVLCASLCLLSLSCARKQAPAAAGEVRVAAVLNLSGSAAQFDAVKRQTLEVAERRIKELYPDVAMTVRVLDAAGGPQATLAATRTGLTWNADYFLSGTSPTALAIAGQVRSSGRPIVQMANAANPDFGPPKEGEYRLWPDWSQEAETVGTVLSSLEASGVLLIHSADPYSEALTASLKRVLAEALGANLLEFQFDPATTPDFRPALLRLGRGPDRVVVVFGLPPGLRALVSQMAEINWDGTLIGGVNVNLVADDIRKAGLEADVWLIETEAMREDLTPDSEAAAFRQTYEAMFNEQPPFHALYLADGLYIIAEGESREAAKEESPTETIESVREIESASGHIEILEDGTLRFQMDARKVQ